MWPCEEINAPEPKPSSPTIKTTPLFDCSKTCSFEASVAVDIINIANTKFNLFK
jgi:hypothetical protein